jgi:hypothetical protein
MQLLSLGLQVELTLTQQHKQQDKQQEKWTQSDHTWTL